VAQAADDLRAAGGQPPTSPDELVDAGWVRLDPVVYEDFLPRSAAGIFRSNLADDGARDAGEAGVQRDAAWLAGALGREVHDPMGLYAGQVARSWAATRSALGLAS
jgi:uncharacterized glyoxalase superfamily metalloenzyme YdcJ